MYEIKFWMTNHAAYNDICDAIRTNIWYEFKRQRITIPFPIRTLHLHRRSKKPVQEGHTEALGILRGEPIFQCLNGEQLEGIVKHSQFNHFGRGERVIEEGAEGQSMFILLRGSAQVSVSQNGSAIRVGVLRSGDCFGEMSLLTGEKRTATVRAEDDCEVLEISKPVMATLLRDAPECMNQLSALLAKRKLENEGIIKDAVRTDQQASKEREYTESFLSRLQSFFEL
jgi:CRP-like cAMP-binding protein